MNNPMSSAAGIRVSLSVRQANGEVKKIRVTCGLGYETPLANYDPDTQSWKTFGDISLWEDCPLLVNLPPSGMTQNGVLYPQPPWEPIIDVTGSSSWPTPTTQDHIERKSTQQKPGSRHSVGLGDAVRMWPTPTTQEVEHPEALWNEQNRRVSNNGNTHSMGLADAVRMWPTPRSTAAMGDDLKGAYSRVQRIGYKARLEEAVAIQGTPTGKLNPMWVEWLMGFPTGWTDLEDSATQSCHK